jgi:hypothetical protein
MVKNVKVDDEAHRLLSVAAAEFTYKKSDLCSVLIRIALEQIDKEKIQEAVQKYEENRPES